MELQRLFAQEPEKRCRVPLSERSNGGHWSCLHTFEERSRAQDLSQSAERTVMPSKPFASLLVVVCCVAAGTAQRSRPMPVNIVMPAWASAAACTVTSLNHVVARNVGTSLSLECPLTEGTISCDGTAVEPVDVEVDQVCKQRALPLAPAQPVNISVTSPTDVTLEWLALLPAGRASLSAPWGRPRHGECRRPAPESMDLT
jgi:hypothetical protein